jgi:hypothetical protein
VRVCEIFVLNCHKRIFCLIVEKERLFFNGNGHSYHIKRAKKISGKNGDVTGMPSLIVIVPLYFKNWQQFPPNLDVNRDASLIAKAKANAFPYPLISARKVVEKELVKVYEQAPERLLPVMGKILRVVQQEKAVGISQKTN